MLGTHRRAGARTGTSFALGLFLYVFVVSSVTGGLLDENLNTYDDNDDSAIEAEAAAFMETLDPMLANVMEKAYKAQWYYNTDVDDSFKAEVAVLETNNVNSFMKLVREHSKKFDDHKFKNDTLRRLYGRIRDIGLGALKENEMKKASELSAKMNNIYSATKVCTSEGDKDCKASLEPDLVNIMASSNDTQKLEFVWKQWHEKVGRSIRPHFVEYINLVNKAAKENGFADLSESWLQNYEDKNIVEKIDKLWTEVEPLYKKLHAYVRMKLKSIYPSVKLPEDGTIPAHLLGNMWAQSWISLLDRLNATNAQSIDVTQNMKKKNWNATKIFKTAESFFVSLDLPKMTDKFWEKSLLVKPKDRNVVCHASAWDFFTQDDFRIKQCTDITQEHLFTAHHEMGHIMYFMLYADRHSVFRDGANEGFHEAVGDVMSLSVKTPEQLQRLGLLEKLPENNDVTVMFQLSAALSNLAFLPFGYLLDKWRWSIFKGETDEKNLNRKFWEYRIKYQGVSPPVKRSDDDFDAGAKYHVAANVPYLRYFVSHIIEFQFHKHLCNISNPNSKLHECNIFNSAKAGQVLREGLSLGASKQWEEAFQILAGTRSMSASAITEYFAPLSTFLDEKLGKDPKLGWDGANVNDYFNSQGRIQASLFSMLLVLLSKLLLS